MNTELSKYIISQDCSIIEAIKMLDNLSSEQTLTLFVVDDLQKVVGSLTDGDVRRAILAGAKLEDKIRGFSPTDFTYIREGEVDVPTLRFIKEKRFNTIPVLDHAGRLIKILGFFNGRSYLPLDAVLMAGGKGERLKPATLTTPKPLLKVGDKPIIDYNIEKLLHNGVENISVTVNYLAEQIEEHFSTPRQNGVQVRCVREQKYLGTMGSIKLIEQWHNDTILVMNSDLFTNINLEDFYLHFKEYNADMSIAAVPYSVNIPYGIFELENTREICGIKEKPSFHYYANAGIYLIKKEILDFIPDDEFFNATDLMQKLIELKKTIIRFPLSGYWIDIGKPEDFKKVQDIAQHMQK